VSDQAAPAKIPRPAVVRFYIDADMLGLAKVLALLRPDITYPGDPGAVIHRRRRPPCPITSPATPDTDWIPRVAAQDWLIITRDRHIQDHPAEIAAVRDHDARLIAFAGRDSGGTWEQLEVFMIQWRRIQSAADQSGPFIYTVTRTTFHPVPLD
jgi:hypothetical protein